uniref:Rab3 GTPase-activating protein catalytic subunit n=1 Tax=Angiostrongylus cantonensis TaxID=6313 RepID=A0A158P688_ANGCA
MEKEGVEEVFEIDDFTVITEFERFVVAVEALVQEWGLTGERQHGRYPKGILRTCSWKTKSSVVNFGDLNKLRVTYSHPDLPLETVEELPNPERASYLPSSGVDMSTSETDFVYHSNITTMFGVSEFLVFSPADQFDDAIITEDQKNLVISAFRVVQHSIDCEVPMFIQFGHIDRQHFFGTSSNKSVVAHYGVSSNFVILWNFFRRSI